jgi:SPP1 family predicted phage head-tail adaptor
MITDYFTQSITTYRKTTTPNGFGGRSETWTLNLTIWALIDLLSGKERDIAMQVSENATHILMCEVGQDITIFDKVVYDSKEYRVLHVDTPFQRHMEILLEYVGVDNNV